MPTMANMVPQCGGSLVQMRESECHIRFKSLKLRVGAPLSFEFECFPELREAELGSY